MSGRIGGRARGHGHRRVRREAQRELRRSREAAGIRGGSHPTRPNRICTYRSVEQEQEARREAVIEHARVIRRQLPILLEQMSKIRDPRKPLLIRHKLSTLMVYGILMFVLHTGSRRRTNERLSAPAMREALSALFPDLHSIPHHDTLYRLLALIEPQSIEAAQVALLRSLIREKKFRDHLVEGHYAIAVDGTQKLVREILPDEAWLERKVGAEGKQWTQYYAYVLEANLVLSNGVSIPLMSEFLDYRRGDSERDKQDCEQRGFLRLSRRLKQAFPHLPILLLLDGMFPTGPIMKRLRDYGWQFMIVLKDGSLPQVWQEYQGLKHYQTDEERLEQRWGDRRQQFDWVNDIEYDYGDNGRQRLTVHLVVCRESWSEVDAEGELRQRSGRWAWLSSLPLSKGTVHVRCNLGGRGRWSIEEGILVEKRGGYEYEHCYSLDWNAMRGYHYLMRIGHLLNVLASLCVSLVGAFRERGAQGFIEWVRGSLSGRWLDLSQLPHRLQAPFQLRLLFPIPQSPDPYS